MEDKLEFKKDWLSTGNPLTNFGTSALSGFGMGFSRPYTNTYTANWAGNGLARISPQVQYNPMARDYASAGQAMAGMYNGGRLSRNNNNDLYKMVLAKLSGLKGNLGNWASREFANKQAGDFTSPLGIFNRQSVIPNDIA